MEVSRPTSLTYSLPSCFRLYSNLQGSRVRYFELDQVIGWSAREVIQACRSAGGRKVGLTLVVALPASKVEVRRGTLVKLAVTVSRQARRTRRSGEADHNNFPLRIHFTLRAPIDLGITYRRAEGSGSTLTRRNTTCFCPYRWMRLCSPQCRAAGCMDSRFT